MSTEKPCLKTMKVIWEVEGTDNITSQNYSFILSTIILRSPS